MAVLSILANSLVFFSKNRAEQAADYRPNGAANSRAEGSPAN